MRQQRSDSVFAPRSTVHIHYNPWRILGLKNIYFGGDEIFNFGNKARKYKKLNNIDKTKIQKYLTNKKLGIEFKSGKQASCADTYLTKGNTMQRTTNWCEENKLKKLIVLNFTERGKHLRDIKKNRVTAITTTKNYQKY